ncbi:hypothetical protein [Curtobacterium sp. PhB137]|jgi:hypothetical protein|uniref:hypothetical protein n=1 Tax=Curtobacterium sp. PhB137 TaxID=2485182 RepID=UPI000F4F7E26|nr:hypothetical protein [Curtobacterium sp. PhB137]
MTDTGLINKMADQWASNYGLVRYERYVGETTLAPLTHPSERDRLRTAEREHYGHLLLDHSRAFKRAGSGRFEPAVMVSAPYEDTLRREIGRREKIVDEAFALADALGMRVRIGHPADMIYDSNPSGEFPILPIVWWKHERFSLAYPPVPGSQAVDSD